MAVYQNSHVKVTIFGTSCDGQEEWSTGFRLGAEGDGGGNFDVPAGYAEALLPLWSAFFTHIETFIHDSWYTTGIKAGVVNASDGKFDISSIQTAYYGTPIRGIANTTPMPPQVTLSAQLAAATLQGLGSKGRMYLPGICHSPGSSGQLGSTTRQNIANRLRTFLDAAEAVNPSPGYVINASKGRVGVPFTPPINRRVTRVRVGSVYDTQRRRRNQLAETYSEAALAA